ncbi:MAG: S16 family serine protease [Clostridia bacterium]|nr:S16 family serine protease [Clostridia bacterium]
MEIAIWIAVQAAMFGLVWWFVSSRRAKAEGTIKRRPTERAREENAELRRLRAMRAKSLNMPLSEKARPTRMEDIVGQQEGIRALRAAMCGPNPQHVLIYGPPGIGKTCAARLVLEEAKRRADSPFNADSKFIELDATCIRFDERSIADPLIGSVHDPIYQGAGPLGVQGIPQPKPGAVTKAHCGVLFLDEIGELHPVQMNKLLKVLEDRRVFFESAYYSPDNTAIPPHIHDIFAHGLPADFRLIGATTRSPEDIPAALRSRCVELFFNQLGQEELETIASDAAKRLGFGIDSDAVCECARYSGGGRDAVNMIQLAAGTALEEGRGDIVTDDIQWVARTCHHARRTYGEIRRESAAGVCAGLAVTGSGGGVSIEIECTARRVGKGQGKLRLLGMVEEEEIDLRSRKLRRKGTALVSAQNAALCFMTRFGLDISDYDITFNVPGGIPMDGPSAGIALCVALMSAITLKPPIPMLAMTGEITSRGEVKPVGGVREKLAAGIEAGAQTLIIPSANYEPDFDKLNATILSVSDITDVMRISFGLSSKEEWIDGVIPLMA